MEFEESFSVRALLHLAEHSFTTDDGDEEEQEELDMS